MNILSCADEPANASADGTTNTDIYTTKEKKEEAKGFRGIFSYLIGDHESTVKEREGIIIVSLDGVFEGELVDVFSDMKVRNDRGVKDVFLLFFVLLGVVDLGFTSVWKGNTHIGPTVKNLYSFVFILLLL